MAIAGISKLSNLTQCLAGYLHQGFLEEFGSPNHALLAFVRESPNEIIELVISELDLLTSLDFNGHELLEALMQLGCYYAPEADNLTAKVWLSEAREVLVLKCT